MNPPIHREFSDVFKEHYLLTSEGFLVETDSRFKGKRSELECSGDRVIATRRWVDQNLNPMFSRRGTTRTSPTSYMIKSYAEKEIGQVSNGVFIAAMICEGFLAKMDGQNAVFNVTKKALNSLG